MKIGFIGTGNMGRAIAKAVRLHSEQHEIYLANRTEKKAKELAEKINGNVCSNLDVACECNFIFLAVKPQMLDGVLEEIKDTLARRRDRFVIVSMAAGKTIETIGNKLGLNCPIIRMMPNTPCEVSEGLVTYCFKNTSDEEVKYFEEMMKCSGEVDLLDEHLIDVASAVAGCSPAFIYEVIEAMADGAVACGLPREKAIKYAASAVKGSGEMVLKSDKHPGKLKDEVCSPAGSTIQGVRVLKERAMSGAFMDAVIAAFEKNRKLG